MNRENSSTKAYLADLNLSSRPYYILGYLLWPFGITLEAFRQWDKPWAKNVFWLFCIYFGFTFIIAEFGGADSARYAQEFVEMAHSRLGLRGLWSNFYVTGSDATDVISPMIMFLVSRFTDNPIALFVIFGLISGYFYSRNVWYVLEKTNGKRSIMIILFLATFILINPIWNINGFRFSVAAQIFLFGTLPYLLEGKKRSLIWSGVSVLAHFTFLFPLAVLGLFLLFRNRLYIYLVFFLVTSFIREISLEWFQSTLSFLPDFIFYEISNYMSEGYAEVRNISEQELPWFITYSEMGIRWVTYLIVITAFIFGRDVLKERSDLLTLLSFSLLFYGFVNILAMIPSGDRFFIIAHTFVIPFFLILMAAKPSIGINLFTNILAVPLLLLFCAVQLRIGMGYFSIITLVGNPFTAILYSDPVALIDQLKDLL